MEKTSIFRKERWLVTALADKENGILTQQDIDNAYATWVNDLDGKRAEEIEPLLMQIVNREEWFE